MKIKNVIAILTFSAVLLTGCYDDSKNATVRINLGNIPVAKQVEKKSVAEKIFSFFVKDAHAQVLPQQIGIVKVHIGAYKNNKLLAKESIDTSGMTSNIIEFTVEAGKDITILAVGETKEMDLNDNLVSVPGYYGFETTDLQAGETTNVTIDNVKQAKWDGSNELYLNLNCTNFNLSWAPSGVKTKYYLRNPNTEEIVYEGYGTGPFELYGQLIVEFEDFDLQTIPVEPGGC